MKRQRFGEDVKVLYACSTASRGQPKSGTMSIIKRDAEQKVHVSLTAGTAAPVEAVHVAMNKEQAEQAARLLTEAADLMGE